MKVAPVSFKICFAVSSLSCGSEPAKTTVAPFSRAPAIFDGAEDDGRTTAASMGNCLNRAVVRAARATACPKFPLRSVRGVGVCESKVGLTGTDSDDTLFQVKICLLRDEVGSSSEFERA